MASQWKRNEKLKPLLSEINTNVMVQEAIIKATKVLLPRELPRLYPGQDRCQGEGAWNITKEDESDHDAMTSKEVEAFFKGIIASVQNGEAGEMWD